MKRWLAVAALGLALAGCAARPIHPGAVNALAVEVDAPLPDDLSITFVDWNPQPPDKSMGLWRDVHLDATGPVAIRFPQVITHLPAADKAELTVSADTGAATLPVSILLCPTDPSTGQCLQPMAPSVPVTIAAGATPTFSVFVTATAAVALAPATARIFVRFLDADGQSHGSTSVAVQTE